jgi:hypothetical protein
MNITITQATPPVHLFLTEAIYMSWVHAGADPLLYTVCMANVGTYPITGKILSTTYTQPHFTVYYKIYSTDQIHPYYGRYRAWAVRSSMEDGTRYGVTVDV